MTELKDLVSKKFLDSGFDLVGFTKATIPQKDKNFINQWISQKLFGEMSWYPKNNPLRLEFQNLGFTPHSVITLGMLYNTKDYSPTLKKFPFLFSRYAVGKDYHLVLKEKAKPIIDFLKEKFPSYNFRQGVDSLPLPEKILARESGIGWMGKNTNLIHPEKGSYFFLSIILTDLHFDEDPPIKDRCGTCRICIDACPTGALIDEYKIDASKCISHHTIEDRRETLPEKIQKEFHNWIYGCDICQSVCPWNQKAERKERFSLIKEFLPHPIFKKTSEEFLNISELEFNDWKKQSAISRLDYKTFIRNLNIFKKNKEVEN